jgi:hypothetical protein
MSNITYVVFGQSVSTPARTAYRSNQDENPENLLCSPHRILHTHPLDGVAEYCGIRCRKEMPAPAAFL